MVASSILFSLTAKLNGRNGQRLSWPTTCKDYFFHTAVPDTLWTDGGSQFTSKKFTDFLQTWGVAHNTSSPHYPQSNGRAKAAIKSMKKIIPAAWTGHSINWDQLSCALLQYRNTPWRKDNLSQAQKLFGHTIYVPAHHKSFPTQRQKSSQDIDSANPAAAESNCNLYSHPLPDLTIWNHVAIQKKCGTSMGHWPNRHYFDRVVVSSFVTDDSSISASLSPLLDNSPYHHPPAHLQKLATPLAPIAHQIGFQRTPSAYSAPAMCQCRIMNLKIWTMNWIVPCVNLSSLASLVNL